MQLNIGYLYPKLLNIYGDRGNIIALKKRCQWRGIVVKVIPINIKDNIKSKQYDLFFGGGGQDQQQLVVANDLQTKKQVLKKEADRGIPMLTICGTYQLFGHYFKTHEQTKIPGISIFNTYTVASKVRKIGNITVSLNENIKNKYELKNSTLVGFENHSGNTFIEKREEVKNPTLPLGRVIKGFGNNGQDKAEGAVYKNIFGCYLHGPLLPKNPHFADLLIKLALEGKYKKKINLKPLADNLEWQAHEKVINKK
ncbi:type 1 glutamine amidotransferase [Patescibacteria group bacterium]